MQLELTPDNYFVTPSLFRKTEETGTRRKLVRLILCGTVARAPFAR